MSSYFVIKNPFMIPLMLLEKVPMKKKCHRRRWNSLKKTIQCILKKSNSIDQKLKANYFSKLLKSNIMYLCLGKPKSHQNQQRFILKKTPKYFLLRVNKKIDW